MCVVCVLSSCRMVSSVDTLFKYFIANSYLVQVPVECLLLYCLIDPNRCPSNACSCTVSSTLTGARRMPAALLSHEVPVECLLLYCLIDPNRCPLNACSSTVSSTLTCRRRSSVTRLSGSSSTSRRPSSSQSLQPTSTRRSTTSSIYRISSNRSRALNTSRGRALHTDRVWQDMHCLRVISVRRGTI